MEMLLAERYLAALWSGMMTGMFSLIEERTACPWVNGRRVGHDLRFLLFLEVRSGMI